MDKPRFKIDVSGYVGNIYGLFFRKRGWFRDTWDKIDSFDTREKAKEKYEQIKDLPEYLA
jgi:hypothetical protein